MTDAGILAAARAVPPHTGFPRVDEMTAWFEALEAEHPAQLTSRRIGTSRLGEPIRCVTIGDGAADIVIVAGVHPNEPIGFRTVQHLAQTLLTEGAAARLDARWHLVPCIDPDGARLNESWFADPSDRRSYARGFYRPAPDEQVEWSFPTDHKRAYFDRMLPETVALMRLLDDTRPALYVSLHNGELGGVYYYLNRPEPALADELRALAPAFGLPLDEGEPESPYLQAIAPAVYLTGTVAEAYDWLEDIGVDPTEHIGGSSSSEYVARFGTLALVAELPYWVHPAADDTNPGELSYREVLARSAAGLADMTERIGDLLRRAEPHLTIDTPFLRASRAFVPMIAASAETDRKRAEAPESMRPATRAEEFSCADLVTCFRYRYGGMLVRALGAEVEAGTASPELRRLHAEASDLHASWLAEPAVADDAQPVDIATLVGIQYGAVLAAATTVVGTVGDPAAAEAGR